MNIEMSEVRQQLISETQDDDSESMSSGCDESKEVPSLLPLSNRMLPSNFAALLASATAAGMVGVKNVLAMDNLVSQHHGSTSSSNRCVSGTPAMVQPTIASASSPYTTFSSQTSPTSLVSTHENKSRSTLKLKRDSTN